MMGFSRPPLRFLRAVLFAIGLALVIAPLGAQAGNDYYGRHNGNNHYGRHSGNDHYGRHGGNDHFYGHYGYWGPAWRGAAFVGPVWYPRPFVTAYAPPPPVYYVPPPPYYAPAPVYYGPPPVFGGLNVQLGFHIP
jgi:hypothetical protein